MPITMLGGIRTNSPAANANASTAYLALRPKLVICDEPVSALTFPSGTDLNLLSDLQEFGLTYIFIATGLR